MAAPVNRDPLGANVTIAGQAGSSAPLTPTGGAMDLLAQGIATAPANKRWASLWRTITENRKAVAGVLILAFFVLVAIIGPFFAPYNPSQMGVGLPAEGPSAQHLLGTTRVGQDVFSQMLYGTRASLMVGFGVGIFATFVAVVIGMTAGFLGGWVDEVLMLITNVFLTLPALPLMIVISTYANAFNLRGLWVIIGVLSITGWAFGARIKRSQTLSLRSKDFVMAAQVAGEPWWRIVFVEIMPNMLSLIASSFIFTAIFAVLGEAGLEYLGLGDVSQVTWGTILYWAQNSAALISDLWWWFLPPGLAIGIFSLGLSLLNYAIDEITNPRLRIAKVRKGARRSAVTGSQTATPTGTRPDATVA